MTVLAATAWKSNAELIHACARLGYLRDDWLTLDPTYKNGVWWKQWRPKRLVTCDIDPSVTCDVRCDFRALPWAANTFDAVAYDPPYVSVGGRTTSRLPGYHDRYGLTNAPTTPAGVQQQINDGLDEMHRVAKQFVLVKCQDYVSSGKLWLGTHHTLTHALSLGFVCFDRFEHIDEEPRPQPGGRRQVHARRNLSTLLVLRKK